MQIWPLNYSTSRYSKYISPHQLISHIYAKVYGHSDMVATFKGIIVTVNYSYLTINMITMILLD